MLWANFTEGSGRQKADKRGTLPTSRNDMMTNPTGAYHSGVQGHGIRLIAGSSQIVETNRNSEFDFPNSKWAISIWFRVITSGSSYALFGKMGASNIGGWGVFILNTGDIQVVFKDNGLFSNAFLRYSASTTMADGKWHHLAINMTSSSVAASCNADIWVDGKVDHGVITQTNGSNCTASSNNLWIGGRASGNYFDGFLSDVRVWNRHLSLPEINMLSSTANIGLYKMPSWLYLVAGSQIKTWNGVPIANVKRWNDVDIGSVKTLDGVSNV